MKQKSHRDELKQASLPLFFLYKFQKTKTKCFQEVLFESKKIENHPSFVIPT
jgi:hypothetical protein